MNEHGSIHDLKQGEVVLLHLGQPIATRSCPLCHCRVIFTWVLPGDPLWPLHLPSSCLSFLISITELLVAVVLTWCCGLKEWCSVLVVTWMGSRMTRRPALGMLLRDYQDQVNRDRLGDSRDCGQPSWSEHKGEKKPAPVFTSPCFLTLDATWPAHLSSLSFLLAGCFTAAPEKLTNTCPGICMLWCQITVWFFVFLHKAFDLPFFPMRNSADSQALCSAHWFCPYSPLGIWLWAGEQRRATCLTPSVFLWNKAITVSVLDVQAFVL